MQVLGGYLGSEGGRKAVYRTREYSVGVKGGVSPLPVCLGLRGFRYRTLACSCAEPG